MECKVCGDALIEHYNEWYCDRHNSIGITSHFRIMNEGQTIIASFPPFFIRAHISSEGDDCFWIYGYTNVGSKFIAEVPGQFDFSCIDPASKIRSYLLFS